MDMKSRGLTLTTILLFLLFSATFPLAFSEANQLLDIEKPNNPNSGRSVVFPIQGNVYPLGHYVMTLDIGNPSKPFDLDIDTGSDLTWVQCDAPCQSCTKPRHQQYKPKGHLVQCVDPLCPVLPKHHCDNPKGQCDYEVQYADHGLSLGVLVRDYIPLRFTNGSVLRPSVAFGCGYDQQFSGSSPPSTAGVLGLGNGKSSILSQLSSQGLIRNVVGHCLSARGGGFIFFGDQLIPSSRIVWTPMLHSSTEKHYTIGPADLLFDGKPTTLKGLQLIFDSGSTYTYLNSQSYKVIVYLLTNDLKGKPLKEAPEDKALPLCWKGAKPFKSLSDVSNYFKPLALSLTNSRNTQLQLPLEAYLIITNHGNVCLGILEGTQAGLGNLNVIGDISLQDKLVVYDNEKQQIGWVPAANCRRQSIVISFLSD